jgi:glycosyltransferase involved in cell wall biosynthesis
VKLVLVGPVYPYRGGIAHYTTMLHQALRTRGHKLLLVSFKRQYPQWLFPGQSDKDPSNKPLKVQDARYWIDYLNPITWLMTFWRIRRYRPDMLILQWWTTFWAPAWFVIELLNRFFLQRPLTIICHNVLPHELHWWDSLLTRAVLQWGDRFVVQSAEEKRQLLSLVPGAKTAIIPLPVFDMFANQRISQKESRKRLGLPMDVPVLLFFGIVREYKGLKDLLASLPKVRMQLGKVILIVAGEFWEDKRPYLEMIERMRIRDSVIVEDRYILNEELPLYFSAADVLVAPYRRVTGSAVLQMARGFGIPVVTTNITQDGEPTNDETSLLVSPGDTRALADTVVRFFTAPPDSPISRRDDTLDTSSWVQLMNLIEAPDDRTVRNRKL